jgi:membrane-bound serine protease (ClpP class)
MIGLAVVLFFVGVVLVVIELFVPSLGVLSMAAGACFVGAIVVAFGESTAWGLGFLGGTLVLVPLLVYLGFKVFPHTFIGRRLILAAPDRSEEERGADVTSDPLHDLVGRSGRALSDLRPAGLVEIDGRRLDVVSGGEWVEAGARVTIIEVEGNRAVVRAEADAPAAGGAAEENA